MSTFAIKSPKFSYRAQRAIERLSRGETAAWSDTNEAAQDLICIVGLTGILSAELTDGELITSTNAENSIEIAVTADLDRTGERADLARVLWAPFVAYTAMMADAGDQIAETGAIPLLPIMGAVVRVSVALGRYAAGSYVVNQAIQAVTNVFQRRQDSADLQRTQAAALEAAAKHVEAEKNAGKSLPLDPATKAVIEKLNEQSAKIVEKKYEQDAGILGRDKEKESKPWYSNGLAVGGIVLVGCGLLWFTLRGKHV